MLCPLLNDKHVVIFGECRLPQRVANCRFDHGDRSEFVISATLLTGVEPDEKDFAIIKRIRQYNAETSINDLMWK